jgi:hypothetical protein
MVSSLFSTSSCERFRRDPRDFSRGGVLSPELLTTLLMYMVADGNRRGYQLLLDGFWDEARSFGLPLPTARAISAASFCTARHKITPEVLRHALHEIATHTFATTFGACHRWHGRRVFAVDGMKVNLQRGEDLERAFGVPDGAYCPQVLVSVMLDVCAKAPVDVEVSGFAFSEREHLLSMLPSLERGDIVVLDRGYPSHEVLQALDLDGLDFLVRVPSSHSFSVIDELRAKAGSDAAVRLDLPKDAPPEWKPISARVIRLKAPDGGESFFLTSLAKTDFNREDLRELYHMRWEAEEFYKLFKSPYIGQGQFRSKSPAGIKQEIHALVLFLAIARVIMATAAEVHDVKYEELSQKAAVLGLADYVTRLFLATDPEYALEELLVLLRRISGRSYKRRKRKSFPRVSFRPRLRWGPGGRSGG